MHLYNLCPTRAILQSVQISNLALFLGWKRTIATTKANKVLGCIHWDIAGDRHRIIPLFPVLVRLHLFSYLQFWAPEIKKDAEGLERVKERYEHDQRAEEPSLRKSWRRFVSSSWRKDCSWRPYHSIPILEGQKQREWKQAQGEGMNQWHLHWERFHIDIRNCSQWGQPITGNNFLGYVMESPMLEAFMMPIVSYTFLFPLILDQVFLPGPYQSDCSVIPWSHGTREMLNSQEILFS